LDLIDRFIDGRRGFHDRQIALVIRRAAFWFLFIEQGGVIPLRTILMPKSNQIAKDR
jgi:hypothetical protein